MCGVICTSGLPAENRRVCTEIIRTSPRAQAKLYDTCFAYVQPGQAGQQLKSCQGDVQIGFP